MIGGTLRELSKYYTNLFFDIVSFSFIIITIKNIKLILKTSFELLKIIGLKYFNCTFCS